MVSHPVESGALNQLWRLSYPEGRLSRLTNDLTSYVGTSVSGDRTILTTTRTEARVGIWVGDGSGGEGAEVVSAAALADLPLKSIAWAGDKLVYTSLPGSCVRGIVHAPPSSMVAQKFEQLVARCTHLLKGSRLSGIWNTAVRSANRDRRRAKSRKDLAAFWLVTSGSSCATPRVIKRNYRLSRRWFQAPLSDT